MQKIFKLFIIIPLGLYFSLGLYSTALAATTCQEKYLNSIGKCAANCQELGDNYLTDTGSGLCDLGQVCCHKVATTGGDIASTIELQVPLFNYAQAANLPQYILNIYTYALIAIVPLAIIMIIIGGIKWTTSAGNTTAIAQAKKIIMSSFIGLGLALFSYTFLSLVGVDNLQITSIEYIAQEDGEPFSDPIFSQPNVTAVDNVSGKQYAGQDCFLSTYGSSSSSVQANLVSINFSGQNVKVHKLAQAAFQNASTQLAAAGLPAKSRTGTFSWRANKNSPSKLSLHSFGIAIDIEWQNNGNCHPRGKDQELFDSLKKQYATDIAQICAHASEFNCTCSYSPNLIKIMMNNGFKWGGTYSNTFDSMHFEWTGKCFK